MYIYPSASKSLLNRCCITTFLAWVPTVFTGTSKLITSSEPFHPLGTSLLMPEIRHLLTWLYKCHLLTYLFFLLCGILQLHTSSDPVKYASGGVSSANIWVALMGFRADTSLLFLSLMHPSLLCYTSRISSALHGTSHHLVPQAWDSRPHDSLQLWF